MTKDLCMYQHIPYNVLKNNTESRCVNMRHLTSDQFAVNANK